jgi:hypothetical protein
VEVRDDHTGSTRLPPIGVSPVLSPPDTPRVLTAYGALGEAAIGRKGYSDRDATCPGEDGHQQVSL